MRRKKLLIAIAALATLGPMQAWGGDRDIAESIIQRLKVNRDAGDLKGFALDMKVDSGVVLFRGSVASENQKKLVLAATEGIEGISKIVDEVDVKQANEPVAEAASSAASVGETESATEAEGFSFSEALAAEAKVVRESSRQPLSVGPVAGLVQPVNAVEETVRGSVDDQEVVSAVVSALGQAKQTGQLKGFGLDVQCHNGVLQLTGRAASDLQRNTILQIAESIPGVMGVRESIAIPTGAPSIGRLSEPMVDHQVMPQEEPIVSHSDRRLQAQVASVPVTDPAPNLAQAPSITPTMTAPYRMQQSAPQAMPASVGMRMGGVAGQPVPMAPYAAAGAPRYDTPNLPNYAWPGYAAHPNYAAVTYPQQYSPTAWPYIGPFYPYPQVPLGWRKVSLEWDDGWWFLDFTDR